MDYTKLPDSETKLRMFLTGLSLFESAGYVFVGLDHFAKPSERLAQSLDDDSIQRNFQGMTTGGGLHLLGVGASSISHLQDVGFLQNAKGVEAYITRVESDETARERGKRFTTDDLIRQAVLHQLYCLAEIRPDAIERWFGIRFNDYFARELGILDELQRDGLVCIDEDGTIKVTRPLGRVLVRNVGAIFDAYLDPEAYRKGERAYFSANA
jgi:oxygen-independent coproporphyrinogen-3 oxidase